MQGVLSARAEITSGFSESFRSGIVTLPKIRNPKLEVRNKPELPKSESQNQAASRRFEPWSFRILNLFRISDFGLRICRASNGGWAGVRIPPESRIFFLHRPLAELELRAPLQGKRTADEAVGISLAAGIFSKQSCSPGQGASKGFRERSRKPLAATR